MILKVLLVIGVISIVYFMFIKKKPTLTKNTNTNAKEDTASEMVECEECGVFVEVHEAIMSGTSYYCSRECLHKAN